MPRPRRPDAIDRILDAGESVLVENGLSGAQMAAIAEAAGIGLGTLYYYFANKEDLLGWVVLRALRPAITVPSEVPVGPPTMTLAEAIAPYTEMDRALPRLHAATAEPPSRDITLELADIVDEFCDLLERSDRMMTVIEVCSEEDPEIRRLWYIEHRRALVSAYVAYFRARVDQGVLPAFTDDVFAARWLIDTCVLFMRFQRLDHYPEELPAQHLRAQLTEMLVAGLAGTGSSDDRTDFRTTRSTISPSAP